jgi:hypothetical protein
MRRPEIFLFFYDTSKGLDYDLYNRLRIEAEYLYIYSPREWIEKKHCLNLLLRKLTILTSVLTLLRFEPTVERVRNCARAATGQTGIPLPSRITSSLWQPGWMWCGVRQCPR